MSSSRRRDRPARRQPAEGLADPREAVEIALGEAHEALEAERPEKAADLFTATVAMAREVDAPELLREAAWHLAATCLELTRFEAMRDALDVLASPGLLPPDLPEADDPIDSLELCIMTQLYWDRHGHTANCLERLWRDRAERVVRHPPLEDARLPWAMLAWMAACKGDEQGLRAALDGAGPPEAGDWSSGDELLYSSLWNLGVWLHDASLAREGRAQLGAHLAAEHEAADENQTYLVLDLWSAHLFGWPPVAGTLGRLDAFSDLLTDEYAALNRTQVRAFEALGAGRWAAAADALEAAVALVDAYSLGQERAIEAQIAMADARLQSGASTRSFEHLRDAARRAREFGFEVFLLGPALRDV